MKMPELVGFDPTYEQFEQDILTKVLRAGTSAIDLGAHTGHYTLLAARYLGSAGKVLAVEPCPFNMAALCRSVWANGMRNVTPLCCAVGGNGIEKLYLDGGSGGDNRLDLREGEDRSSISVVALSLHTIIAQSPQFATGVEFMKIDVQGRETITIESGGRFFVDNPNMVMLVEYSPYDLRMAGSSGKALLAAMFSIGCMVAVPMTPKAGEKKWATIGPEQALFDKPEDEKKIVNLLGLRGKYQEIVG